MARSNGEFSRWVVQELSHQQLNAGGRIVELGPGPGVGLEEALQRFPRARVWGVDISPEMISQSRNRNQALIDSGRLTLILGSVERLAEIAPIDVVFGNHVLYFWHDPALVLQQIHGFLRPGGVLALGYQLKRNMPPMAQKYFPLDGHRLYEADDQMDALLRAAGFATIDHRIKGSPETPEGRVAIATA